MNAYVNYLIEANLGLVITLLFHELLLRRETQFNFKRAYLLIGISASLLFPLIKIQAASSTIPSIGEIMPTYFLPELVIGGGETSKIASSMISYWVVAKWIYLTVSVLLFIRLIVKLSRILSYLRKSKVFGSRSKFNIIESNTDIPTFSFFHFIFIGNTSAFSIEEKDQIIKHEITHASKLHSLDILLVEFLKIIFWFNPAVYYLKSLFTSIHEFQADQLAVDKQDVNQYCNLLARVALQSADYPIANHFNNSLTLKRIAMMKTAKTKLSRWKIAAIASVFAGLFILVACQDQIINDITKNGSTITQTDFPPEIAADIKAYKEKSPSGKDQGTITYITGDADEIKKLTSSVYAGQVIIKTYSFDESGTMGVLLHHVGQYADQLTTRNAGGDEIFTIVEEPASPVGGMPEFYKLVGEKMMYPLEARTKGIQGRVFVEFIINTDGSLTDIKTLKGIGSSCDEEAARVVSLSPPWVPGKQRGVAVRQRMVLPVTFKLDGSGKKVELGQTDKPTMSELVVTGYLQKKN